MSTEEQSATQVVNTREVNPPGCDDDEMIISTVTIEGTDDHIIKMKDRDQFAKDFFDAEKEKQTQRVHDDVHHGNTKDFVTKVIRKLEMRSKRVIQ